MTYKMGFPFSVDYVNVKLIDSVTFVRTRSKDMRKTNERKKNCGETYRFIIRIWIWIIKNGGRCQNLFSRRGSWRLSAFTKCTYTVNTRKLYRERNADHIRTLFAVRAPAKKQHAQHCGLCFVFYAIGWWLNQHRFLALSLFRSPLFVPRWFRW